jgi:amino acid adenylation domain-containing protein
MFPGGNNDSPSKGEARKLFGGANTGLGPMDGLLRKLPWDRRSSASSVSPAEGTYRISSDRMDRLWRVASTLGTAKDTFFLTTFATLLGRLSGQDNVAVRNVVGEPILLRFHFKEEMSFRSLIKSVEQEPISVKDHSCAVEFGFTTSRSSFADLPDYCLRMMVCAYEEGNEVFLSSTTGSWDQAMLRLWLRYFDRLLAAAGSAPDVPWKTLPVLDPIETHKFYQAFNATTAEYPADCCVHELVTRQAEKTPAAVAVVWQSESFTYRQLESRSSVLAANLQALGAGSQRPVALCMDRSVELPTALVAVLKAGSCCVPLDPQDAPQRMRMILEECRPATVIAEGSFRLPDGAPDIPILRLSDISDASPAVFIRPADLGPDSPAYIIYTSGTTGKPKGVSISHRALSNLLHSMMKEPGFTSADRLLAISPISFDIAMMEMFLPLITGGTVVVADRLLSADPVRLAAMLQECEITVLQATPWTWRLLASSGWHGRANLKMISGGDILPRDLAEQLLRLGGELWNCYGPTETTIYSGVLKVRSEEAIVTIGPPMGNTVYYILDGTGRLVPPGVPGELYIGGAGLGDGYVELPELTRQRFLPDPYSPLPEARMYKTGDVVRLLNDREFEFFGRLDQQVKLRGYRIELEEIESVLRTFPAVHDAVVGMREESPGEPYLIAFISAGEERPNLLEVRNHLSQRLPTYMLPSRFVILKTMPLTGSGKVDRKALLASDAATIALAANDRSEGVEPETELETKLLTFFRDVLGATDFGVTDSFFDFGGYSMLTVNLFTRINRALTLNLPISLLFDAPTVRALARMIEGSQPVPVMVPIRPLGRSAPLFVIHSYLLYGVLPQIVEPDRPVYGLRELPDASLEQTPEGRAAAYAQEIHKVYSDGPLLLTGWCAAGSLTVEVARQLLQLDRKVGLIALFDAERPGYHAPVRGHRIRRIMARLKFHYRRLRGQYRRKKVEYLGNAVLHVWDRMLEWFFIGHRKLALRLQRRFGFALPDAVFNTAWSRIASMQIDAPAIYPGKVLLFRAKDVPQLPESDETLGWRELVQDGVEVVFVPGDHETMFHDPYVGFFSERLRQALQQAG